MGAGVGRTVGDLVDTAFAAVGLEPAKYVTVDPALVRAPEATPPVGDPNRARRDRIILQGDVPSPANPPKGCNFCTRCPKVFARCTTEKPVLQEVEPGRHVACFLYDTATNPAGSTSRPEAKEHNQQGETR